MAWLRSWFMYSSVTWLACLPLSLSHGKAVTEPPDLQNDRSRLSRGQLLPLFLANRDHIYPGCARNALPDLVGRPSGHTLLLSGREAETIA